MSGVKCTITTAAAAVVTDGRYKKKHKPSVIKVKTGSQSILIFFTYFVPDC